jgi:uncharacterized protein (TIGR03067 family)
MPKPLVPALLAALLVGGCGRRDDAKRGLDGVWAVASVEWGGTNRDPGQRLELTIDGDRWSWKYADPDETVTRKCRIDSTTAPASVDLIALDGPDAGLVIEGIYELHGDTLKLAYGLRSGRGSERPHQFGGERVIVMVLRRKR